MWTRIHFLNNFYRQVLLLPSSLLHLALLEKCKDVFQHFVKCLCWVCANIQASNVFCSICWESDCFNQQVFRFSYVFTPRTWGFYFLERQGGGTFWCGFGFVGFLWVFFFETRVLWHNYTIRKSYVLTERRKKKAKTRGFRTMVITQRKLWSAILMLPTPSFSANRLLHFGTSLVSASSAGLNEGPSATKKLHWSCS